MNKMKNKYKRLFLLLTVAVFTCSALLACDTSVKEDLQQNQPNVNEQIKEENNDKNQTNEEISIDETVNEKFDIVEGINEPSLDFMSSSPSLHYYVALSDNSFRPLIKGFVFSDSIELTENVQITDFKCGRFAFLSDGSIVDMMKTNAYNRMLDDIRQNYEPEEWDYFISQNNEITESFLNDLNKSVGIIDIRYDIKYMNSVYWVYNIYTADGKVYQMDVNYATKYSQIETPILNLDRTLNCPQFSETEEWTDIVDYRIASNFILALTSDGKLLSSGIEFEHENIVKFDIWDVCYWDSVQGDLPVALTADGNLLFGELTSREEISSEKILENIDKQIETAKTFTDVEDFTFYGPNDDLYIIVQKTDGSIWATQKHDTFTEYVNIP